MILDIPWALAVACVLMAFIGAVVQGTLGIGLGMVASPVLALTDPDFIPGAVLLAVLPLTVGVAIGERASVDRRGVGLATAGRLPGTVIGAAAVAWTGPRFPATVVGVSVLLAVLASMTRVRFQPTDRALLVAGLASGFGATTSGVGGPPIALTYQHGDPAVMRSTISVFFTIGAVLSITALWVAGSMTSRQVELAALLVPGVIAGFVVSRRFARLLRHERARVGVLGLCAVAAIALLVEEYAL
ncbi:MAG: sulfite exporter TauE/SafE family protein [Ilumatobacteraceae bacterium]